MPVDIVPLVLVFMVDGARGLRQTWPAAVVGGLVFAIGQYACSNFVSIELTDIVASLASTAAIVDGAINELAVLRNHSVELERSYQADQLEQQRIADEKAANDRIAAEAAARAAVTPAAPATQAPSAPRPIMRPAATATRPMSSIVTPEFLVRVGKESWRFSASRAPCRCRPASAS